MQFQITYSTKTFDGIINAGQFTVEAGNIEFVQENAFMMIANKFKQEEDEEDETKWNHDIQSIDIGVSEI